MHDGHASPRIPLGPLGPVQETMMIPVWARALETGRADALLRDPAAARVAGRLDVDFSPYAGAWKSQIGVVVRSRVMDDIARAFLARHPGATVVNLGAGLDTRFHRVDDGRAAWIDVDLPDALAVRERCLPAGAREQRLSACALDGAWIDVARERGAPVLVLAEGLLMFLDRARVRALLGRAAATLGAGEMAFDVIGPLMVRVPRLHDTLPRTRARFRWGLRSPRDLDTWTPHWSLVRIHAMLDESPTRWRWMRTLRAIPFMRHQFVVAHTRFG